MSCTKHMSLEDDCPSCDSLLFEDPPKSKCGVIHHPAEPCSLEVLESLAQNKGVKHDQEKNRLELIPPEFIEAIGKVLTHGAIKYSAWNWRKGLHFSRCYGALQRHLNAWYRGENLDSDTNYSHLWHAACELLFLIMFEMEKKEFDDRPKS